MSSVRAAFALHIPSSSLVRALTRENSELAVLTRQRTVIASALALTRAAMVGTRSNMSQLQGTVAATTMGGFDIGTSGQGYSYGILSSLTQTSKDAGKFGGLLNRAKALGLDPKLLEQLASEGPVTAGKNLEALVNAGTASKGYIGSINTQYAQLGANAQGIGKFDAQMTFGKELAAEQAKIASLTRSANIIHHAVAVDISKIHAQLATLQRELTVAARRQGKI